MTTTEAKPRVRKGLWALGSKRLAILVAAGLVLVGLGVTGIVLAIQPHYSPALVRYCNNEMARANAFLALSRSDLNNLDMHGSKAALQGSIAATGAMARHHCPDGPYPLHASAGKPVLVRRADSPSPARAS